MISAARFIIVLAFVGSAFAQPGKPPVMLNWIGQNDVVVRAGFVAIENEQVVVALENGTRRSVPFTWFSPQSLQQARDQEAKRADGKIAPVTEMEFCYIRRGRFIMGSPVGELGRLVNTPDPVPAQVAARTQVPNQPPASVPDFEPEHRVNLSKHFWLKSTEVTMAEWKAVRDLAQALGYTDLSAGRCGFAPGNPDNHPVTDITWWDAVKWCNAKSQIENKTPVYYISSDFRPTNILITGTSVPQPNWEASGYRLPTEAEWEYACREGRDAGSRAFHSGPISAPGVAPLDRNLAEVAWYAGNSGGNSHPVGGKPANGFGLRDMHGNVAEWCWDLANLLTKDEVEDPRGGDTGPYRMFRGGSWADPARCCRAAYRGTYSPIAPASYFIGFRPASSVDPQAGEKPERKR